MHQELRTLLDEHKAPQHASKRNIHDQLRSILLTATRISRQMGVYREQHLNAKLAPHAIDPVIEGKLELLKLKYAAAEKACTDLIWHGERLAEIMTELEVAAAETERDLASYEAARA